MTLYSKNRLNSLDQKSDVGFKMTTLDTDRE